MERKWEERIKRQGEAGLSTGGPRAGRHLRHTSTVCVCVLSNVILYKYAQMLILEWLFNYHLNSRGCVGVCVCVCVCV